KKDSFTIIGYVRKSPLLDVSEDIRIKYLQSMMDALRDRSGEDMVYISPCSKSTEPIVSHDAVINTNMLKVIERFSGDTQGKVRPK
ncbi:hypothetical protein BDF14DRAFT_1718802, partial [Spinellus fusiger]